MGIYNNIKFISNSRSGSITPLTGSTADPIMGAFRSAVVYTPNNPIPIMIAQFNSLNSMSDPYGYPYNTLHLKGLILKENTPSNAYSPSIAPNGFEVLFNINTSQNFLTGTNLLYNITYATSLGDQSETQDLITLTPPIGENYSTITNGVQLNQANNGTLDISQLNINFDINNNGIRMLINQNPNMPSFLSPFFVKGQYLLI